MLMDMPLAYFEPIAKDIGSKSGFRTPHCLGFRFVLQLKTVTNASNNGIQLIVIIEHVMGHKKYVVSHALQRGHSGGIVVEYCARAMNDLTLKLNDYRFHRNWIYNHNVAVTNFLACYLLSRKR